jgi:hypothetical protein
LESFVLCLDADSQLNSEPINAAYTARGSGGSKEINCIRSLLTAKAFSKIVTSARKSTEVPCRDLNGAMIRLRNNPSRPGSPSRNQLVNRTLKKEKRALTKIMV